MKYIYNSTVSYKYARPIYVGFYSYNEYYIVVNLKWMIVIKTKVKHKGKMERKLKKEMKQQYLVWRGDDSLTSRRFNLAKFCCIKNLLCIPKEVLFYEECTCKTTLLRLCLRILSHNGWNLHKQMFHINVI